MDWSGWAVFGLLATTALTAVLILSQLGGLTRMDLPMCSAPWWWTTPTGPGWLASSFTWASGRSSPSATRWCSSSWAAPAQLGAGLGILHALVALTVLVPLLPGVHPRMASTRAGPATGPGLEPPGLLGLSYGRQTVAVAVVAHLAYGLALGLLLDPH